MTKTKFQQILIDEGFNTIYEKGYPEVITSDETTYKLAVKEVKKMAQTFGYNESFGVKLSTKTSETV